MKSTGTGILAKAALTVFAFAIAFAFGEMLVRLLYKSESVLFPRYHTDYRYGRYTIRGIRPNVQYTMTSVDGSWEFVTNGKGFRNAKDFSYAKPEHTYRVLSLGDSHTQGYEVRQEATFSAVLERYLRRNARSAEVLNSGVSGFGTAEELVFLENEGFRYNPDAVVLGFFANDFLDNVQSGLFGLDTQNRLTEQKFEHTPGVLIQNVIYRIAAMQWLSENSYFYSLLFNNVWNNIKRWRRAFAAKGDTSDSAGDGVEYAIPTGTRFTVHQIALAAALIERMHRFCADRHIRFIVVDIPRTLGPYRYVSSLPPVLRQKLTAAQVEYIGSDSLLQSFDGIAEFHAPHGHHHISELTHLLAGIEIGRRLLASGPDAKGN